MSSIRIETLLVLQNRANLFQRLYYVGSVACYVSTFLNDSKCSQSDGPVTKMSSRYIMTPGMPCNKLSMAL